MDNGIFHKRLQSQLGDIKLHHIRRGLDGIIQPLPPAELLNLQVAGNMLQLFFDSDKAVSIGEPDAEHLPHQLQNPAQLILSRFNGHPVQLIQHVIQKMGIDIGLEGLDLRLPLLLIPALEGQNQLLNPLILLAVAGK
ncbi:hypothetical protein D3C75_895910 [compost metagenome]